MNGEPSTPAALTASARLFPELPAWRPDEEFASEPVSALVTLTGRSLRRSAREPTQSSALSRADVGIWRLLNHLYSQSESHSSVLRRLWTGLDADPHPEGHEPEAEDALLHTICHRLQERRQEAWIQYGSWEQATLSTLWTFQWGMLNDFGARLCGPEAVREAIQRRLAQPSANSADSGIPVEFSHAAFRLGLVLENADPDQLFGSEGERAFTDSREASRPISPDLPAWAWEPLGGETSIGSIHLPLLALLSGLDADLPSGQAIAERIAAPQLAGSDPLWIYILREAEAFQSGQRLGPVGARIVADTLVATVFADRFSYLSMKPEWTPEFSGSLADFLFGAPNDQRLARRIADAA